MLFSSLVFLFVFLPIVLVGNLLLPSRVRNVFLLLSSFVFFAWGGVSYLAVLLASLVVNYFVGLLIARNLGTERARLFLIVGVVANLLNLGVFKYADFFAENINSLLHLVNFEGLPLPGIVLPIGISFYTFQAISYLVDVYRIAVPVQKRFVHLALYVSFFPQLIAGPIVRYFDIAEQIANRRVKANDLSVGIKRFVLGLAKKVLIANQFAYVADTIFSYDVASLSVCSAWGGALAYMMQIYFDFSGYSDMAIGLGRMFGFHFLENFNFPYVAQSIQDFWRRWHISLSNWFRDYLYIPLGGNRRGTMRTLQNLFVVFLLTGWWHGASWNFIVWGVIHGVFLIVERSGFGRVLAKTWKPIRHAYTLLVVLFAWVFFRAEDLPSAIEYISAMFGANNVPESSLVNSLFVNVEFVAVAVVAVFSSTLLVQWLWTNSGVLLQRVLGKTPEWLCFSIEFVQAFAVAGVIYATTLKLLADSYNPFIYFRF